MGKVKYDVTDVDPGQDFDTPIPKGVYKCKIVEVNERESQAGNDMLEVVYEVAKRGEFKGRHLWDYITLTESQEWKLAQFVQALGKRQKGTLDTDKLVGEMVLVKVKHETDNRDPDDVQVRARVGSVSSIAEDNGDLSDQGDDEEEDEADADEAEAESDEDITYEDVQEMDLDELKELIEEEELETKVTKRSKVQTVRDKVVTELDLEPEEDDDEGTDEDITLEDLEEMDRDELETLVEDEELEVKFNKRTSDETLVERIAEALELEDDEDDEDEDEAPDYSEMSISELRAELKNRNLETKGRKPALIERLEEDDDSEDGNPF